MTIDKEQMQAQANTALAAMRGTGLVPEQELQIAAAMSTTAIEVLGDLEEKGGFKAVGANAVEGETTTDGPVVALMTNNGPAKIEKTNTKVQGQSDITGKSAGNGELTIALTQASPAAIKKVLTDVVKADKDTIEAVQKSNSTLPNKVVEAEKNPPKEQLKKAVAESKEKQEVALGNPFTEAGAKFSNVLASLASLAQGTGSIKDVGTAIVDTTSEVEDPETGEKTFSKELVKEDGTTNLAGVLGKGGNIGNFFASISALNIKSIGKGFSGRNTNINNYVFEELTSQEEYELEITNSTRELQNMIISWTGTAADEDIDIKEIHRRDNKRAGYEVDAIHGGIQAHFVVFRNGQVLRGRPLDQMSGSWNPEALVEGAVNVQLVAGSTESKENPSWKDYMSQKSITDDQFGSLDMLIESFFKCKPGAELLSIKDIDPDKTEPGFSGITHGKKFNKESIYQDSVGKKFPVKTTVAEIVEEDPPANVQGVPDPSKPVTLDEIKAKAKKDEEAKSAEEAAADVEKAKKDIAKAKQELSSVLGEAAKIGSGLLGAFSGKAGSAENFLETAIKVGQENSQNLRDKGYKWDPKKEEWNKP